MPRPRRPVQVRIESNRPRASATPASQSTVFPMPASPESTSARGPCSVSARKSCDAPSSCSRPMTVAARSSIVDDRTRGVYCAEPRRCQSTVRTSLPWSACPRPARALRRRARAETSARRVPATRRPRRAPRLPRALRGPARRGCPSRARAPRPALADGRRRRRTARPRTAHRHGSAKALLARLVSDEIEHDVDIPDAISDPLARVVDRLVDTELVQERVLSERAVPITWAPRAFAICTARCPTPPAAPRTSALCPGSTAAVSTRACHAVSPASGSAAASTSLRRCGVRASWRDGDVTYSARRGLLREARHAETRSPTAKRVTPRPSSSTTPATSHPTVNGGCPRKPPPAPPSNRPG